MFFSYGSPEAYTALAMSFIPHGLFSLTMFPAFMSLLWKDGTQMSLLPSSLWIWGLCCWRDSNPALCTSSLILHHSLLCWRSATGGKAGSDGVTSNQMRGVLKSQITANCSITTSTAMKQEHQLPTSELGLPGSKASAGKEFL